LPANSSRFSVRLTKPQKTRMRANITPVSNASFAIKPLLTPYF
jgi:hypothetical protein